MSLLLTGALVATGVLVGRFAARAAGKKRDPSASPPNANQKESDEPENPRKRDAVKKTEKAAGVDWSSFPCKLGDVVLRAGGDEAWLAGALVFSEDLPVAALFIAPDVGGDRGLFVRPSPASMIWLAPLGPDEVKLTGEPPSVLEQGGERFERTRRLPLRCERVGSGAPDVGDSVIVAEYTSAAGETLLVLATSLVSSGGGATRAWRGQKLEEGTYDVLPSGD